MKIKKNGFTVIELIIVIVMMMILSGVVSKLWYGMAKIEKSSAQRAAITMKAQDLIHLIRKEVRQSVSFTLNEEIQELQLSQITSTGETRQVRFYREDNEMVRQVKLGDQAPSTMKLSTIDENQLVMRLLGDSVLELMVEFPSRDRPLSRYDREYKTQAYLTGGTP